MAADAWIPTDQRPDGLAVDENRAVSVLAVSSELPWPLDTGGHLRTFHLLRTLAERFRVRLVSGTLPGQDWSIESLGKTGINVCPVKINPRIGWQECLRAAAAAARREPYVLYRRHDRAAVRSELERQMAIEPPDILYLDHIDSLVYAGLRGQTPILIDLHNVYSTLAQRVATEHNSRWKRWYLRREAKLLECMERRAAHVPDQLFTVSEDERLYFEKLGARNVKVVPNGVDCEVFQSLPVGRVGQPPLVLYLGNMSWGPNVSAASFLARELLPPLLKRFPEARLRIVGRSPNAETRALASLSGVEVIGDVPDIKPYLGQASVLAVPLDSGGGTRLKILEAFAAGLPVVSTPVGCEGLGVRHGEHLLIAERDQFADAIGALFDDEELALRFAARARTLACQRFDWKIVGQVASNVVSEMASARPKTFPARSSSRPKECR
jgi:glycosyltransferase involved in cell wall biosynthesis